MNRSGRIFLAFLAVIALACVVFGAWRGYLYWRVASLEAGLRAAGIPVTVDDLAAAYPLGEFSPDMVNEACDVLIAVSGDTKAYWQLPRLQYSEMDLVDLRNARSGRLNAGEVARFVSAAAPAMALFETAMDDPAEVYVHQWPPPAPEAFPRTVALQLATQIFVAEAWAAIEAGDGARAVERHIAARRLAELCAADPSIGAQVTRYAMREIAFDALPVLLTEAALTDAELEALDGAWRDSDEREAVARQWAWVFAHLVNVPAETVIDGASRATPLTFFTPEVEPGFFDRFFAMLYAPRPDTYWLHDPADMAWCLQAYGDLMAITDQPTAEWRAIAGPIRRKVADAPPAFWRSRIYLAPRTHFYDTPLSDMTRSRVAHAAIAVQRYRLATGTIPGALADLVPAYLPEVPADPRDGISLQCKALDGGGFVVFNTGPPSATPYSTPVIKDTEIRVRR